MRDIAKEILEWILHTLARMFLLTISTGVYILKGHRSEKNVESPIEQMWYFLRVLVKILILSFGNELSFIIQIIYHKT